MIITNVLQTLVAHTTDVSIKISLIAAQLLINATNQVVHLQLDVMKLILLIAVSMMINVIPTLVAQITVVPLPL
jgi:hypothetical protein